MVRRGEVSIGLPSMKSKRRSQMAAIARQREEKRSALLEQCKIDILKRSQVSLQRAVSYETPFDEGSASQHEIRIGPLTPSVEPTMRVDEVSAEDLRSLKTIDRNEENTEKHRIRKHDLQERSKSVRISMDGSMNYAGSRKSHFESSEGAPFDESKIKAYRDSDTVNYSSLVHFRSNEEKKRGSFENSLPKEEKLPCNAWKRTPTFQRDGVRLGAGLGASKTNFFEQLPGHSADNRYRKKTDCVVSSNHIQPSAFRKRVTSLKKKIQFNLQETARMESLPSDEESTSSDTESQPSLDAGTASCNMRETYTPMEIITPFREIVAKKSRQGTISSAPPTELSLAEEVARFMLFRDIRMLNETIEESDSDASSCDDSLAIMTEAGKSEITSEPRTPATEAQTQQTEKEPETFSYFTMSPPKSVAVKTSERIMKSIHSRSSGSSSVENIIIWSESRQNSVNSKGIISISIDDNTSASANSRPLNTISEDRDLLPKEVATLPLKEALSGLNSDIPHTSTSTRRSIATITEERRKEGTPDTFSEDENKSVDGSAIPPPPYAGKAKKDREESLLRDNKKVWSFYDPLEINKLSIVNGERVGNQKGNINSLGKRVLSKFSQPHSQRGPESTIKKVDKDDGCSALNTNGSAVPESGFSTGSELEDITPSGLKIDVNQILNKVDMVVPRPSQAMQADIKEQDKPQGVDAKESHNFIAPNHYTEPVLQASLLSQDSTMISDTESTTDTSDVGINTFDVPSTTVPGDVVEMPVMQYHASRGAEHAYDNSGVAKSSPDAAVANLFSRIDRFNAEQKKNQHSLFMQGPNKASHSARFPEPWYDQEIMDEADTNESGLEGLEVLARVQSQGEDIHFRNATLELNEQNQPLHEVGRIQSRQPMGTFQKPNQRDGRFLLLATSSCNSSEENRFGEASFTHSVGTDGAYDNLTNLTSHTLSSDSGLESGDSPAFIAKNRNRKNQQKKKSSGISMSNSGVSSLSDGATYAILDEERGYKRDWLVRRSGLLLNLQKFDDVVENQMISLVTKSGNPRSGGMEDLWDQAFLCKCDAGSFDDGNLY